MLFQTPLILPQKRGTIRLSRATFHASRITFHVSRFTVLLCLALLVCARPACSVGIWVSVTRAAPSSIDTMLLMGDGTVIGANGGTGWYKLTPDSLGSYVNGTWTTVAPMNDSRLYYSSQVMTDGRMFIAGGEYGTGLCSGEVYDPVLNLWVFCPASGQRFSDSISAMVPNGNVLVSPVGPSSGGGTIFYNPTSNLWITGPKLFRGGYQDEASWVKLPDSSILTVDPFGQNTERYIPSLNQWVNDATVPVALYNNLGELGPAFLLPNGKVIYIGGTTNTAIYTPSGTTSPGSWVAGPVIPGGFGATDAPGAMMVNGKVLACVGSASTYNAPAYFYEYDSVANAFTATGCPGNNVAGSSYNTSPYVLRMLALPDGTVLTAVSSSQLYVYVPDGSPLAQGQPVINSVTANYYRSYHMTGTGLNGISEGAAYGDDAQMDSNYPLIRMTNNTSGLVYYARSYNWSSTSVMTSNTVVSTDFILPASLPTGSYSLVVSVNGNASAPYSLSFTADPLTLSSQTGYNSSGPTNGPFLTSAKAFTLNNTSGSPLNWAAGTTGSWLALSLAGGTIAGGGNASVTVSNAIAALALGPGNYPGTVWFTNLTSGAIQSVPFYLQVFQNIKNPGFETGSSGYWTLSGTPGNTFVDDRTDNSVYVHSGSYAAFLGQNTSGNTSFGYLSQTVPTGPGLQYTLSFWLNHPSIDSTPAEFQVFWNGSMIFDQTYATSFAFTNVHLNVTATASSTSLQFGFRSNTNYFGLDDVALTSLAVGPSITVQPANTAADLGLSASFSVTAGGTSPLSYQWRLNSNSIPGATSNVFTLSNVQATNAGSYSVLVTNLYGSILSSNALLTVLDPFITNQPQGQFVAAGGTATFTVGAGGTFPLSYQWKENGLNLTDGGRISGSQTATLTISNMQSSDVANYSVLVSNTNGSVLSAGASLIGPFPPTIVGQPASQTVLAGSLVPFSVSAAGPAPLTYQWQEQGTNISDGAKFSGTTTANLLVSKVQAADMANYSVIVGNAYGSIGSSNAFLSLFPLVCWGLDSVGQADIPPGLSNITAIACGGSHELVLHTDGTMAAWGAGTNNTGINPNYGQAMIPPGLTNVTAIAGGGFHTLAAKSDGTVVAWGLDTSGQTNVPAGLSNVIAVAAGSSFSLALKSDGTVTGWGLNNFGQAAPPAGLTNAVAIAAGTAFSLALASDHTVVGWGRNNVGQTSVPPDLTNAVAVAAGSSFGMALRADGTVTAWGANDSGQTNMPPDLTNVAAIACGSSHAIVLKRDGSLIAWGSNIAGQTNIPMGLSTVIALAAGGSDNLVLEGVAATAPGISAQPQGVTVDCGTNAAFLVSATGTPPLAYQWLKNGVSILGATTNNYSVVPANCQSADSYTVIITNVTGSITSSVATLSVVDTIAPTILCPSNLVLNTTTGQCSAIANYSVTATDNCSIVSLLVNPPSGSFFLKGTNVVVCTATDCGGNTNTCSFTVTVLDQEMPVIACPTNQTLACNTTNGAQAFFSPTATDNCDGSVPVVCTPPSGSYFLVGTNLVTCVANDSSGNTNNCTFTVTVVENQPLLSISISGTNCVLVWPQSCANYQPQQTPSFDQPWSPVAGTPSPIGTNFTITVPLTNSAFFRLRQN
ncbi:MAG: hypothetical protein C5B50_09240 [Verrucomicrobia bacterium]|nr:MAG: hypothetical protein C5B50_09240 [Verrucomicrobiota bacterium]